MNQIPTGKETFFLPENTPAEYHCWRNQLDEVQASYFVQKVANM